MSFRAAKSSILAALPATRSASSPSRRRLHPGQQPAISSIIMEHPDRVLFFVTGIPRRREKKKKKMVSGILEVQLLDAKGLKKTDVFGLVAAAGRMDPYVILQYRSDERKSSVARDQDRDPAWNETFKFRVQYPAQDNQYKLILRIMDKDTFTRDDFVGEATVHLGDVIQVGAESGFSELRPRKYNVVLADRTYCGEIRLGVTFTRKEDSLEEEVGGWKHSHGTSVD